ncbi:MAG: choice-of-anchor D domain-containing protein [Candidatus Latescibacteria bacterium]|nr:choice-of-anchor D domain-containing protein [Candidatus Latescibacterota bacterium]
MNRIRKIQYAGYIKIILFLFICILNSVLPVIAVDTYSLEQLSDNDDLIQSVVGNCVLGFQTDGIYIADFKHTLKISFVGAHLVKPVNIVSPVVTSFTTINATCPETVTYRNLWDGVTLFYERTEDGSLKSTYYITPTVNFADEGVESFARNIRLRYNVPVSMDGSGNLLFAFETGQMKESTPIAWQEKAGQRIPVEVDYCMINKYEVGFSIGECDPHFPLIIDPVLSWNTFAGSAGVDIENTLAVDGNGNIYIAGYSGLTWGAPVNAYTGGTDICIVKLNNNGVLQWNTFLGSGTDDTATSLTADGDGNVYVTGYSDATWGAPVNAYVGGKEAFVLKLNTNGALQWSTFLGSAGDDEATAIGIDFDGNVYLTGFSGATWGAPIVAHAGGNDAFSAKLNNNGVLQWNTFMGSAGDDKGNGLVVDGSGNVFVTGNSDATWGAPVTAFAGAGDAFAVKLDTGGALQWSTFLGSGNLDEGNAIALNGSGNIYITGVSLATWGAPVNAYTAGSDVFVVKMNGSGAVQWNTFLGSATADVGHSVAVKGDRNIYVTGVSDATWGAPVNAYSGNFEIFTAKLNINGALHWNTFLGSADIDYPYSVAADLSGNIYLAGFSLATWGAPVNAHAGAPDGFAAKFISSDMDVLGNGNSIVEADVTPSATDHTDFGNVLVVSGTVSRTFTVTNYGSAILNLTGTPKVNIAGAHAADFTVTAQPASPLASGGGSTTFTVQFDPSASGLRSATISIENDDNFVAPYIFAIQGTGTVPEIDVQGNGNSIADGDATPSLLDNTDFGSADVEAGTVDKTFTIMNTGTADLNLTGSPFISIGGDYASNFSIVVNSLSPIAPGGGTTTFTIRFNPTGTGVRTATLSIANDDSDENPYNFSIQGTGTGNEPVPTMNEWGMIFLIGVILLSSFILLKSKKMDAV